MDQQAETLLPSGYQKVVFSNEPPVQIAPKDIPWMGFDRFVIQFTYGTQT